MHFDDSSRLIYLLIMPRVVADQRRKFETEESFLNLSRPCEVRYTGLPLGTDDERRIRFQQDCRDGRIEIACIPSGFNLELYVTPSSSSSQQHLTPTSESSSTDLNRDYIEIGPDRTKVHICSHFILNGVCVRWRGWIDSNTLRGQGNVEFDEERARLEDQRLRQERTIEERLRHFEHHQPPFLRNLSIPTIPANAAALGPGSSYSTNHAMPLLPSGLTLGTLRRSSSSSSSSPNDR